jgi:hypothetical protein
MKKIILTALIGFSLALVGPLLTTGGLAYADCPSDPASAKGQALNGIGVSGSDCDDSGVSNIIKTAVGILSIIAGIVAVIMVIISGFRYMTSAGDSGKIASAKNTLIYALVGLAIAALAQFLVHFVITQATSADSGPKPCPTGRHRSADGKLCIPD